MRTYEILVEMDAGWRSPRRVQVSEKTVIELTKKYGLKVDTTYDKNGIASISIQGSGNKFWYHVHLFGLDIGEQGAIG